MRKEAFGPAVWSLAGGAAAAVSNNRNTGTASGSTNYFDPQDNPEQCKKDLLEMAKGREQRLRDRLSKNRMDRLYMATTKMGLGSTPYTDAPGVNRYLHNFRKRVSDLYDDQVRQTGVLQSQHDAAVRGLNKIKNGR